ncbi:MULTISPECIES: NrfD/PsrC family molybdoenzyme membrane anchor subunit [unclassified Adlercreutzia]|uniref:NrfD/PsrC family molybdoenzyme membrane anchor subunit n=1 Tax=unclassified Adlercreutzia TaxID=2636013 RepID=UPI0013EB9893|nr:MULTISPECIES: NrfD/PsrC family molybdoenzyme membrane anchor subunit [unclassified Adlercreutzia]
MTTLFKKPAFIVLVVLAVVGIACWIYQLLTGLGITGMSNANSWGLYIIMFMLFVGLSAGGLIVASSASVFHIKRFKAVAMPAVILSTACICVAGMFVLIDVGGIQRIWWMLISPNFTSPLLWDMCVIILYLVINILYLVFMSSKKEGAEHKVEIISRFALPIAILVHSITAWIFGLQIAKEGWYTAILAPIFVASAMDSGLALLLCVLSGLNKSGKFKTDKDLMATLSGLLCACIAVDAFFIGCEVLTMAYPGAGGADTLAIMLSGSMAPFFWFEVIGGLVIPFCILVFAKNRKSAALVVTSSVLVILGVLCKRIWLLLTAFAVPNLEGAPGVALGTFAAQEGGAATWNMYGLYVPTIPEIFITIGAISVGAIIFWAIAQKLLISSKEPQASDSVDSQIGSEASAIA